MAKKDTAEAPLRPNERVILSRDIRGVPQGTGGVVKVANGLTWARYWVQFDNGEWVGSVSATDLVREGDWEAYKARLAEEALRPKSEDKPAAVSAADAGTANGSGSAPASKVPPHLLERSQKARARKAAGGG